MSDKKVTTKEIAKKETPIQEKVLARIGNMQKGGQLELPQNYSAGNAINAAYLILQETVTRDKKPVLTACTQASIANALLSMVIQGLSPDKTQAYFIAYGNQLQMQRSYFGAMAVAKRVDENVLDFRAQPIYEGDDVQLEIRNGKQYVIKHTQSFGDVDKKNITGAYCTVIQADNDNYTVVMTMEEIKASWNKSQMRPIDDKGNIKKGSTHDEFTGEMAKRTVINRAAKHIINTSDDSNIVKQYAVQNDVDNARYEAAQEIDTYANQGDLIDADTMEIVDADYTEIMEVENVGQIEETATEETEGKGNPRTGNDVEPASTGKERRGALPKADPNTATATQDEPF